MSQSQTQILDVFAFKLHDTPTYSQLNSIPTFSNNHHNNNNNSQVESWSVYIQQNDDFLSNHESLINSDIFDLCEIFQDSLDYFYFAYIDCLPNNLLDANLIYWTIIDLVHFIKNGDKNRLRSSSDLDSIKQRAKQLSNFSLDSFPQARQLIKKVYSFNWSAFHKMKCSPNIISMKSLKMIDLSEFDQFQRFGLNIYCKFKKSRNGISRDLYQSCLLEMNSLFNSKCIPVGSFRRGFDNCPFVDLIILNQNFAKILDIIKTSLHFNTEFLVQLAGKRILCFNLEFQTIVDLKFAIDDNYIPMLFYFTGSFNYTNSMTRVAFKNGFNLKPDRIENTKYEKVVISTEAELYKNIFKTSLYVEPTHKL